MQSQEHFDRENDQRDGRKWKTTARPRKTLPGSPDRGHEKSKRGRNRAGTTRKDREEVEVLRGSLHGAARVLQAAQLICNSRSLPGCADGGHVLRPTRGSSSPRRCPRRSRTRPSTRTWIRTDLDTRGKYRELKRKLSDAAQSARQGGTEPGTTCFRDVRRTTGPPAPRRGPGAPTAQPRPRGPDLESAQI